MMLDLPLTRAQYLADHITNDPVPHMTKQSTLMRLAISGGALHCFVESAHEPTDIIGNEFASLPNVLDCSNQLEAVGKASGCRFDGID
jgi:hypothetical protein